MAHEPEFFNGTPIGAQLRNVGSLDSTGPYLFQRTAFREELTSRRPRR